MRNSIKTLFVTAPSLLYPKRCILETELGDFFDVHSVTRLSSIGNCLAENTYDLIVIQISGKKTLKIINMILPAAYEYDLPIILFTEDTDDAEILEFIKTGVADSLDINRIEISEIKHRCQIAVERHKVTTRFIREIKHKYIEDRKESIQNLTGGIAHQFNNLLAVIMGNLELLERDFWDDRESVDKLNACNRAALRMSDITSQLLAYSSQSQFVANDVPVNNIIQELIPDIRKSLPSDIGLKINIQNDKINVKGDINQIELMVLNLVKNSAESISTDEGVIELFVFKRNIDIKQLESGWLFDEQLISGDYICISIRDNGCGIDPSILDRIFDPFYSTKFTGRGLGLSAVRGIVFSHLGAIKMDTEVNKYTQVEILLPCAETRVTEPLLPSQAQPFDHQEETIRGRQ